jgi:hypothetical protein
MLSDTQHDSTEPFKKKEKTMAKKIDWHYNRNG